MKASENVGMAFKNILSNKVRSFLTMLGIIIGVGAVIVMISIGEGAKQRITSSIQAMGSNLLIVTPGRGGRGGGFGDAVPLTEKELNLIAASSSKIRVLAPEVRSSQTAANVNNSMQTTVEGCTVDYPAVRNYKVHSGRFFTDEEVKGRRKVVVLGSYVASELFGEWNPVGEFIKVGRVRAEIIGVLEEKGQSGFGNSDDLILAPITMVQQKLVGNKNLNLIYVQVQNETDMSQVEQEIDTVLLEHYKGDDTKYSIRNQAEILSAVQESTQTFTLLLAGIAAVSLLVGGIGIMNIMLVSVTERIREIGIRKAIGARKEEILSLFLIEAVMLSLSGGLIGIVLGCTVSKFMGNLSGWSTSITSSSIILSFVFSIAIGLFFGVYPAYKASGLNPIEALRHE